MKLTTIIGTWEGSLITIAGYVLLLILIKRVLRKKWPKWLQIIDFLPPLLLLLTYELSLQRFNLAITPFLIFAWCLMGIASALMFAYRDGEIIYTKFSVFIWKLTDIYMIVWYLIIVGLYLV